MGKKIIVLVEDKMFQLKNTVFNLQSTLSVARKRAAANAPDEGDTEICVLHLIGDEKERNEALFNNLLYKWEERAARSGIPQITYFYDPCKIDCDGYPANGDKMAERIARHIRELGSGKSLAVILDVILVPQKDQNMSLDEVKNGQMLSHKIDKALGGICIPYTLYGTGYGKFRDAWRIGTGRDKNIYDKDSLDRNTIDSGFRKELYKLLNIVETE